MCGRFTKNYTWQQIHAMYSLLTPAAIPNMQPSFNVCPTDPVDVVVTNDGKRELETVRWGLIPFWWGKPLKELRLATFNARVETVATKPFFREPFKSKRCLMPMSGYYEWQDTLVDARSCRAPRPRVYQRTCSLHGVDETHQCPSAPQLGAYLARRRMFSESWLVSGRMCSA
jgi:putative SOS response-associated peptidase YedK